MGLRYAGSYNHQQPRGRGRNIHPSNIPDWKHYGSRTHRTRPIQRHGGNQGRSPLGTPPPVKSRGKQRITGRGDSHRDRKPLRAGKHHDRWDNQRNWSPDEHSRQLCHSGCYSNRCGHQPGKQRGTIAKHRRGSNWNEHRNNKLL